MFCTQCGTKAVSDAKFCANCGAALAVNREQTEQQLQPLVKSAERSSSSTKGAKTAPTGIGGWLMVLIVGMIVLGPLSGAGQIYDGIIKLENQHPSITSIAEWKSYKTWMWWQFFFFAGLSIYGGWSLVSGRNRHVINQTMAILWMIGPVARIIMAIIMLSIIGNSEFGDPRFIGSLVSSIIAAGIWTAYLSKSKRVRNTYGCS